MSLKHKVRELYATGMSQRQIASELGCAKSTVHHHLHVESRVKQLERQRKTRKNTGEMVQRMKEASPCMDCGVYYPYYVMDYDHVRGEKLDGVGKLSRGAGGIQRLLEEIAKCDLVCSNCHRKRTYERGQHCKTA